MRHSFRGRELYLRPSVTPEQVASCNGARRQGPAADDFLSTETQQDIIKAVRIISRSFAIDKVDKATQIWSDRCSSQATLMTVRTSNHSLRRRRETSSNKYVLPQFPMPPFVELCSNDQDCDWLVSFGGQLNLSPRRIFIPLYHVTGDRERLVATLLDHASHLPPTTPYPSRPRFPASSDDTLSIPLSFSSDS